VRRRDLCGAGGAAAGVLAFAVLATLSVERWHARWRWLR